MSFEDYRARWKVAAHGGGKIDWLLVFHFGAVSVNPQADLSRRNFR